MTKKLKLFNAMIMVFSLLGGLVLGVTLITSAISSAESPLQSYPVNANGQTYGSDLTAELTGETPDLVLVEGDNGVTGYAYAKDLEGPAFSSPEEAVAYVKSHESLTIPVYASDGITVLGSFTMGIVDGVTLTEEEAESGVTLNEKIEQANKASSLN